MSDEILHLTHEAWEKVAGHAVADYPAECCGILTETAEGSMQVHPCRNIQDKLHERDPEAHPRTSKTAYRMDDLQVHKILSGTESEGGRLRAFYHSHIDCEAYFSEEDHKAAMFMDGPAYPDAEYLVVSVCDRALAGQKAFSWAASTQEFVEHRLQFGE